MLKDYYKDFGVTKVHSRNLANQELFRVYQQPKKDVGEAMPRFQSFEPNLIHQADLLFLPNDNGYRYALVVIDNYSRKVAAAPLTSKKSDMIRDALIKIYEKGVLKQPKKIEVDDGSEFKGEFKKYFKGKGVEIRSALPGRHRQQALVERANQTIGTALIKRMTAQELLTGKHSREWTDDIQIIVESMNKYADFHKPLNLPTIPIAEKSSQNLLPIGTKVRVALDEPRDVAVTGQRLHGKFRSGDIKFDLKIRYIRQILIKPGFPPMYLLDGKSGPFSDFQPVAYTRNQLQVVSDNEEAPNASVIRGKPDTYTIQKILDRKKENNKIMFQVKWKAFPEPTWVERKTLNEDVPEMVKEFELKLKEENKVKPEPKPIIEQKIEEPKAETDKEGRILNPSVGQTIMAPFKMTNKTTKWFQGEIKKVDPKGKRCRVYFPVDKTTPWIKFDEIYEIGRAHV